MPIILVHYNEIALKGNNRRWFEDILIKNIRVALAQEQLQCTVSAEYGRLVLFGGDIAQHNEQGNRELTIVTLLKQIPGIGAILVGVKVNATMQEIEEATLTVVQQQEFTTFAIDTHRTDKRFPYTSMEMNKRLGALVVEKTGAGVNLTNPDLRIGVTITDQGCYVTWRKHHGREGLPVGSSGTVLSLLSSGIDSPVASSMMLTRGCQVVYLHFHSYPLTSGASMEIVKQLTSIIHRHQPASTLLLAPLGTLQQHIVTHAPSSYRVILYRRAMFAIAERLARQEHCHALCTGESIGQVASQTIPNMAVATEQVQLPIFRPLIGMNKSEIVERAHALETFELSTQPYEDCCSLLVPQRVETRADIKKVQATEAALPWDELIQSVVDGVERHDVV